MTITNLKTHLASLSHSGTLNKVRNLDMLLERVQYTVLGNLDPTETERNVPLTSVIHDDLHNYPLPSDFKKIIDLYPQANRSSLDSATRVYAEPFDLKKALYTRQITIEGSEGSRILRVNWKKNNPKVYHSMNSLTANGTWSAVGTASGLKAQQQVYFSGSASIEFDSAASGDGIQNTTATALDLTNEDEIADVILAIYFGDTSNVTSVSAVWGNDLTSNYWTGVAQTAQADGTSFKVGWNLIKIPWSTATETGTVTPASVDSMKVTVATTGTVSNIRVDNIMFSIGRVFDIKYYSQYVFQNTSGTFLQRHASDSDSVILTGTAMQIFIMESLKAIAQQIEGEDSAFDIAYANRELYGDPGSPDRVQRVGLYAKYRADNPSMAKKALSRWSAGPRFKV